MQVFFVNGNPRAGKDTFVDMVRNELRGSARAHSYIDPVKEMLDAEGIDWSQKTEADRRLLADMGIALERHSSYLSKRCVRFVRATSFPANKIVFIYAREQGPMRTVETMLQELDPEIVVRRLLVTCPQAAEVTSNHADAGVNHIAYDIVVDNDADLEALELLALHFAGLCRDGILRGARGAIPRKPLTLRASGFTPIEKEKAA